MELLCRKGRIFFLLYSPDAWVVDVIEVVRNPKVVANIFEISDSVKLLYGGAPWICSSGAIFQSWNSTKHASSPASHLVIFPLPCQLPIRVDSLGS
jgi:hypothetical protein